MAPILSTVNEQLTAAVASIPAPLATAATDLYSSLPAQDVLASRVANTISSAVPEPITTAANRIYASLPTPEAFASRLSTSLSNAAPPALETLTTAATTTALTAQQLTSNLLLSRHLDPVYNSTLYRTISNGQTLEYLSSTRVVQGIADSSFAKAVSESRVGNMVRSLPGGEMVFGEVVGVGTGVPVGMSIREEEVDGWVVVRSDTADQKEVLAMIPTKENVVKQADGDGFEDVDLTAPDEDVVGALREAIETPL